MHCFECPIELAKVNIMLGQIEETYVYLVLGVEPKE